jgi:activator of 2-hydroxyglutaryl-CoA dehydratase
VGDLSSSTVTNGRHVLIGADLGKVTTSLAWGWSDSDGSLTGVQKSFERHRGLPLEPLARVYRKLLAEVGPGALGLIAATGHFGSRLGPPVITGLPEETTQEYAARRLYPDGPLNVIRVGASGFSILVRDAKGGVSFESNDRCSAGTGETIERLCERLGSSLEEASELASHSESPLPLTARCSVFAKSELTHYANQGEPHEHIFRGYFESVGLSVHSLVAKHGVDGPLVIVGNGARIVPLIETLERLSGREAIVADEAGVFEALGALFFAAERFGRHAQTVGLVRWPERFEDLVKDQGGRIRSLLPAAEGEGSVVRLREESNEDGSTPAGSSVLGLDIGSTGSKAAVLDAATGAVLADAYRRTDGNPVEAAKALVVGLLERGVPPVVAIGVTGSGRDAVATVVRAAYPEAGQRVLVQNEIVAHATAAVRYDPDGGRSLSIVEIGGQDAKFINVEDGRVLESDMNRVCSAGTGSFLEEQAVLYGVDDITELGRIAERGEHPPDLGQMCTVFIADLAVEALGEGFTREGDGEPPVPGPGVLPGKTGFQRVADPDSRRGYRAGGVRARESGGHGSHRHSHAGGRRAERRVRGDAGRDAARSHAPSRREYHRTAGISLP